MSISPDSVDLDLSSAVLDLEQLLPAVLPNHKRAADVDIEWSYHTLLWDLHTHIQQVD